ncbi:MAG: hypothetical protein PVF63_10855 [Gammaproteobacteria bacterium]|jgi:hypothetical protein
MPEQSPGVPARDWTFREELRQQRWDDHRFYHHSRINQSLHLFSACCFLTSYVLLAVDPSMAPIVGWVLAMCSRQIGHFFFEPKGFDRINRVSHEHKEDIKVGYNLRRKVVLMSVWAALPVVLLLSPAVGGLLEPHSDWTSYIDNLALAWLVLGIGGLLFRTVHLFFISNVQTGLVWFTKILTDPFNDVRLYAGAPLALARGQLLDPMLDISIDDVDPLEDNIHAEESDAPA